MMHRLAFTLAEILVSIMIFMMVSAAMFGIFLSVTQLYRQGEYSRSANDESQIVAGILEKDIVNAVPASSGGVFFAWLDEPDPSGAAGESSGNCVVGWVVRNNKPNFKNQRPFSFVLWGIERDLSTEPLRRYVFPINTELQNFNFGSLNYVSDLGADLVDPSDDIYTSFSVNNPHAAISSNNQYATTVASGCLHFSASLTGTMHSYSGGSAKMIATKPSVNSGASNPLEKTTYWTYVTDNDSSTAYEPLSEPANPGNHYSNLQSITVSSQSYQKTYPNAVRFSVVLSGNDRFKKEGVLQLDLQKTDTDYVRFAGIEGVPSTPGSILRIGNSHSTFEWIGYYQYDVDGCKINTAWEHGPCYDDSGTVSGRGVLKSTPKNHTAGARVRIGRLLTLTRTFPQ